jgi:hypothetical protein
VSNTLLLSHFSRISADTQSIPALRRWILDVAVRGGLATHAATDERAAAANLESLHYRTQLIERLSWATADAEALKSDVAAGAGNFAESDVGILLPAYVGLDDDDQWHVVSNRVRGIG